MSGNILCHLHSEPIKKIDSEPNAQKLLYCYECILQSNDPKGLQARLLDFPKFCQKAAEKFQYDKMRLKIEEVPSEFKTITGSKTERVNQLMSHLKGQMESAEQYFEEIRTFVLKTLDEAKKDVFEVLTKQAERLETNYDTFGDKILEAYPNPAYIDKRFPSAEVLESQIKHLSSAGELESFCKDLKNRMKDGQSDDSLGMIFDNNKKLSIDFLAKSFKKKELPLLKCKFSEMLIERNQFERTVRDFFHNSFILKDPVIPIQDLLSGLDQGIFSQSSIIKPLEFFMVKEWLPHKYEFDPRLLYRGVGDDINPQTFHSKCDGQGATITLIKGRIPESPEPFVIGGFLDQDWHNLNAYIESAESFIFSITNKVKCDIVEHKFAAYGAAASGPVFGLKHDLFISKKLHDSAITPHSYANAVSIMPYMYQGSSSLKFIPLEIEVYALS